MKKLLLVVVVLFVCSISFCHAQTPVFYGMTPNGGTYDSGTIFMFNPSTNKDTVVWNFSGGQDGSLPQRNLVMAPNNGELYAMTYGGGANGEGTIVRYTTKNNSVLYPTEYVPWSFGSGQDGQNPLGDLVYDSATQLFYGITRSGLQEFGYDVGSIISYSPYTGAENVVFSFGNFSSGWYPVGNLAFDPKNGLYYGMTAFGGTNNEGIIFSFDPANNSGNYETDIWSFGTGNDGYAPLGSLVFDPANGIFYGMTSKGGTAGGGTYFSFDPTAAIPENVIWNFGVGSDGSYPVGSMVYNPVNGLLYGMTNKGGTSGGGIIFSIQNTETVLWSFNGGTTDGFKPGGDLTYDAVNGLYYGMTNSGGSNGHGTIFKFNTTTGKDSVLWNFGSGTDGADPTANLAIYLPVTVTPNSTTICSGSYVTLTASGATSYKWSPAAGLSATSGATVTATSTFSNYYTVTGTIGNGIVGMSSSLISTYGLNQLNVSATPSSYCSGENSTLTVSGGNAYTWSPSIGLSATTGSTVTTSVTATTTYTVSTITTQGCTNTGKVIVTVNPKPVITASANPANYCSGGSTTLTASGGSTYTWTPATALIATTGSSVTASPMATTTYTVTGTNSSGCSATNTVTVTVNPNPTINASEKPSSYCAGGSSVFMVSGGTTYTWSPSIGLSATTGSSVTASPTVSTVYTVTGKNVYGCVGTRSGKVTVNAVPTVSITPSSLPLCSGSSSTLKVSGATTYAWSPSAGLSNTTGTSLTVNPTVTTTYTVAGTNSSGCIGTKTVTVTVNPVPTINASESPSSICAGSSSVFKASGASTYTWAPATGLNETTGSSVTATPTVTTTYTVTGTNIYGCTGKKSGKLTVAICAELDVRSDSSGTTTSGVSHVSSINEQLSVYPNPTSSTVFVKINSGVLNVSDWTLRLTDVLGRTLYTKQSLNYNNVIDLTNLPSGIYFITVVNKTDRTVFKVVKQS